MRLAYFICLYISVLDSTGNQGSAQDLKARCILKKSVGSIIIQVDQVIQTVVIFKELL